jgi:tetratricopeptide (TPR) repeat protein
MSLPDPILSPSNPRALNRALPHAVSKALLPLAALLVAVTACEAPEVEFQEDPDPPARQTADIGNVDFPTSCSDEAQPELERGVALLHHMTYVGAEEAFSRVAELDQDCAMAQWGLAMAHFQPFWGDADLEGGRPHAQRAVEMEAPTERERAYAEAVLAFYHDPDASYPERVRAWEAAMEEVHRSFPEDQEVAAFYALGHLSSAPYDPARQERALSILEEVLQDEPRHPGAIHYAIHVHDVDARAEDGERFARAYEDIAPTVPHALHMPSHIYVRLGEWDEVIEWNRRSADAALEQPAGGYISMHHVHALDYLMYGYLQKGQDGHAEGVLQELRSRSGFQPLFGTAYGLASIPARWYVERRDWAGAAGLDPRVPESFPWDEFPESEAIAVYARGLGAARTGDTAEAGAAHERLEELESAAQEEWGDDYWPRQIQVKRGGISAWVSLAEGRIDEAVEEMRATAALAEGLEKSGVTPGDLQPAHELLGDLLMEIDRPSDALEAYEASLDKWPARHHTLLGAARAAEATGDEELALDYWEEFAELTADADPGREGVAEARDRVDEL